MDLDKTCTYLVLNQENEYLFRIEYKEKLENWVLNECVRVKEGDEIKPSYVEALVQQHPNELATILACCPDSPENLPFDADVPSIICVMRGLKFSEAFHYYLDDGRVFVRALIHWEECQQPDLMVW